MTSSTTTTLESAPEMSVSAATHASDAGPSASANVESPSSADSAVADGAVLAPASEPLAKPDSSIPRYSLPAVMSSTASSHTGSKFGVTLGDTASTKSSLSLLP